MRRLPSPRKTAYCLTAAAALILILSALAVAVCSRDFDQNRQTMAAEIYKDGTLVQTIRFSEVREEYSLTVTGGDGSYNVLLIGPDGVRVLEASCPEKLCIRQGLLTNSLLPVTCLPNRLVIRLVNETPSAASEDADAVTY